MSKGTTARAIRVPDELWQAARAKADEEGITVTDVVVNALRSYTQIDTYWSEALGRNVTVPEETHQ